MIRKQLSATAEQCAGKPNVRTKTLSVETTVFFELASPRDRAYRKNAELQKMCWELIRKWSNR